MTQKLLKNCEVPPYIRGEVTMDDYLCDTGLYPDSVILALCEKHNIPYADHGAGLLTALEFAAKRYADAQYVDSLEMSSTEVRRHLSGLVRTAQTLRKQIANLPHKARQAYHHAQVQLEDEFLITSRFENQPQSRMEKAGTALVRAVRREETEGGWVNKEQYLVYTDYKEIENAFKQITLICETAVSNLKPDVGGRPDNRPLFAWVSTMSRFWIRTLKRPYTIDGFKGEVVTATGSFLKDCLEYLDPTVSDQIYSQMRRYKEQLKIS